MYEVAGTIEIVPFLRACGTYPDFESAGMSSQSSNLGVSLTYEKSLKETFFGE